MIEIYIANGIVPHSSHVSLIELEHPVQDYASEASMNKGCEPIALQIRDSPSPYSSPFERNQRHREKAGVKRPGTRRALS